MTGFFDKPVMQEVTIGEQLADFSGTTERMIAKYRREMFAYRVRMFLCGAFVWFLIYVFWVGVVTVFGVGK